MTSWDSFSIQPTVQAGAGDLSRQTLGLIYDTFLSTNFSQLLFFALLFLGFTKFVLSTKRSTRRTNPTNRRTRTRTKHKDNSSSVQDQVHSILSQHICNDSRKHDAINHILIVFIQKYVDFTCPLFTTYKKIKRCSRELTMSCLWATQAVYVSKALMIRKCLNLRLMTTPAGQIINAYGLDVLMKEFWNPLHHVKVVVQGGVDQGCPLHRSRSTSRLQRKYE